MTSKEALGTLTFVLNQLNGKPDRVVNECYDVIKKDLEVLEILKKHSRIKRVSQDFTECVEIDVDEYNEDFKKVKDWLEDDKK